MGTDRVDLLPLWHMHQPDYRGHARGEFALPWVYPHAAKDDTDMAAHRVLAHKLRGESGSTFPELGGTMRRAH